MIPILAYIMGNPKAKIEVAVQLHTTAIETPFSGKISEIYIYFLIFQIFQINGLDIKLSVFTQTMGPNDI